MTDQQRPSGDVRLGDVLIATHVATSDAPTVPAGWTLLGVVAVADQAIDYRAQREAAKLALREIARRTGINPGRLSSIERGLIPTDDEAAAIRSAIAEGSASDGEEIHGASPQ